MLLAGDLGGTKTLLGLFDGSGRPAAQVTHTYATNAFASLENIVDAFLTETRTTRLDAISIGVAGPPTGLIARLTNVPWLADATNLATRFQCPTHLLNDLEAMAYAVPVLEPAELRVLQAGRRVPDGNAALIAAGTGLGEALLHNVDGRLLPSASEGGHADFAARTSRELALVAGLARIYGRVDNECVISGHGLADIFRFTHVAPANRGQCPVREEGVDGADLPAAISACALDRRCDACVEALQIFVEAYGAEAGNLALRSVATAGVFIGGGIAPKILPALETGGFMNAFCDKPPLVDFLRAVPVSVILNPHAGLVGAAVHAALRL